ncbi:transcriptional regulator [Desulfitobacterium dehalogenans ATCC 51507]|uniref:Transcriptional regulator n=1 Tax=Desulfitobacterium dehalogenans (strain ATCC 51507 / DSM 9161 / JW/IU-DC1) TaxID=756499 RepID=I4A7T8_DESDJ|nr:MarR family transcriptional regulator [Desulfitobacterium dehalogenans]AFM00023.1 transcriptional regulator [Desulfitobacterium dehalogenans ATCC 51507]
MQESKTVRLFETIKKFRRLSLNFRGSGEIPHREIMMLKLIKHHSGKGGITISTLSEHFEISKPAVSQMINALEDKNYVERITTKSDRRMVYVRLTELGEEALAEAFHEMQGKLEIYLEKMGEQDMENLIALLDKLHRIMKEDIHEEKE